MLHPSSIRRGAPMQAQSTYNYTVVRQFAIMTVVWGIVGMLVGVLLTTLIFTEKSI